MVSTARFEKDHVLRGAKTDIPSWPFDLVFPLFDAIDTLKATASCQVYETICSLSRAWRDVAQARMYRHPVINAASTADPRPTLYRCQKLLNTLRQRPDLAESVRILDLGRWTALMKAEAKGDRRAISSLAIAFVAICPNLTTLDFPSVSFADADSLTFALSKISKLEELNFGHGPIVRDPWIVHLDPGIRDEFGSMIWTMSGMERIFIHWPNLKSLKMGARIRTPRSESSIVLPCRLTSFSCEFLWNHTVPAAHFYSTLDNSRDTLRHLDLCHHQLEDDALPALLSRYGANLKSLRLRSKNTHGMFPVLPPIVESCRNLKELYIETRVYITPSVLDSLAILSDLEEVELVNPALGEPDIGNFVDAIKRIPRLKRFTLGPWDSPKGSQARWTPGELAELKTRLLESGLRVAIGKQCGDVVEI